MTTATTTAIQTVSANIDERRFLGNLQTMFSTTSTFLGELMQNARRSGSPQIRFDYESNESTLEVTDSGCGIDCYQTLITIAKSGWDEKVMVDDRPFGMGFASVIFAGKGGVEVASHGKQICFTADDFIEKRPIQIQTSDFSGGTRVRIKGMHLAADSVDKSLRRMAKGFAIDVLWNGDLLPRPYEQTSITGEMTAVGYIHIPYIHD